jgi:hypothetical protein
VTARAVAAAVVFGLLTGCAAGSARPVRGRFHGNGVSVAVWESAASDGGPQLTAEFRPDEPGFHLYSVDLPPEGVDGIGVATSLDVRGGLRAVGALSVSAPVRSLAVEGVRRPLPVYPDGPVTLTVPVTGMGDGPAEVTVSYAACSESSCLPPVVGQPITLAPA